VILEEILEEEKVDSEAKVVILEEEKVVILEEILEEKVDSEEKVVILEEILEEKVVILKEQGRIIEKEQILN
jgi:hypothetical protein